MTTANVTASGMKPGVQAAAGMANVRKKAEAAADVFGAMMSQYGSAGLQNMPSLQSDSKGIPDISGKSEYADVMSGTGRGVSLTSVQEQSVSKRIDSSEEELADFEESAIAVISETLGVTEEEIQDALEAMDMTVFDLLNPQNLGMFVMQLVQMDDSTQLLMNPEFQTLMSEIGQLGSALMGKMELNMDQMDEVIRQMDVAAEQEMPIQPIENMSDAAGSVEEAQAGTQDPVAEAKAEDVPAFQEQEALPVETGDVRQPMAAEQAGQENPTEEAQQAVSMQPAQEAAKEDFRESADDKPSAQGIWAEEPEDGLPQESLEPDFSGEEQASYQADHRRGSAVIERTGENAAAAAGSFNMPTTAQAVDIPQTVSSYASVDTMELIHQVVEQIQSAVRGDMASIEMQLNPEHLGRLYVSLTSKAGSVNAQFVATNEAVRAALETQLADLRENLNQAGVKVDAIEITVASHELEENLEQNARQEERQAADQEENQRGRRNITLSELNELDELSGVLTEEEILVAQMMKDSGNSMDVTV